METRPAVDKMTVVVTGNQGYIGSVLTAALDRRGWRTAGYDLGIFRDVAFIPRTGRLVRQIYKDIREAVPDDFAGADVVIHLAGLSNDPLGELDPALTEEINFRATVRVAEAARAAGVRRFIFSSSCSVYGRHESMADEASPLYPQTAYAASKAAAEGALLSLETDSFLPLLLRNATVYGLSPRLRLDLMVQDLAARAYLYGTVEVLSDGPPWRPLVHVGDVARACIFFSQAPAENITHRIYNVGRSGGNYQVREVAEQTGTLTGAAVRISGSSAADSRSYRVDFSRLAGIGWQGTQNIADGLREVLAAYQKRGLTPADFSSSRYITLQRYQEYVAAGLMDSRLR